jgi:hypothetical protein
MRRTEVYPGGFAMAAESDKQDKNEVWGFRDFNKRSAEISTSLRTWFVAYGIGAPVLFFSRPEITAAVKASGHARTVVFLFFSGVALQVLNAFMNKWLTWFRSEVVFNPEQKTKFIYRWGDILHKVIWIDVLVDLYTIVAFGIATFISVLVFV